MLEKADVINCCMFSPTPGSFVLVLYKNTHMYGKLNFKLCSKQEYTSIYDHLCTLCTYAKNAYMYGKLNFKLVQNKRKTNVLQYTSTYARYSTLYSCLLIHACTKISYLFQLLVCIQRVRIHLPLPHVGGFCTILAHSGNGRPSTFG